MQRLATPLARSGRRLLTGPRALDSRCPSAISSCTVRDRKLPGRAVVRDACTRPNAPPPAQLEFGADEDGRVLFEDAWARMAHDGVHRKSPGRTSRWWRGRATGHATKRSSRAPQPPSSPTARAVINAGPALRVVRARTHRHAGMRSVASVVPPYRARLDKWRDSPRDSSSPPGSGWTRPPGPGRGRPPWVPRGASPGRRSGISRGRARGGGAGAGEGKVGHRAEHAALNRQHAKPGQARTAPPARACQ